MESHIEQLINDRQNWNYDLPPMAPNDQEIDIYKELVQNYQYVVLLGLTKRLITVTHLTVDLAPSPYQIPHLNLNWIDLDKYLTLPESSVVIGDGAVNLVGERLIHVVQSIASSFIFRVFKKKFSWMKYARYFPNDFGNAKVFDTQQDISIVQY